MTKKIETMIAEGMKKAFKDGYKQGFRDGYDERYAEELEQPQPNQSGSVSITAPVPIGYLCENAVGHKYFRWKKPSSTYKPIPLYATSIKEALL
jgi:hypothetical protein